MHSLALDTYPKVFGKLKVIVFKDKALLTITLLTCTTEAAHSRVLTLSYIVNCSQESNETSV